MSLSEEDYARLLSLRTGLRRFQRWSEQQAQSAGLTPAQHQLLLAIRGHGDPRGPTIGEAADYLLLRHHSTVELVDRADNAGLVTRRRSKEDHRIVRLQLTALGAKRLEALSALHLEELERLALRLPAAWRGLALGRRPHGLPGEPSPDASDAGPRVQVARVYEAKDADRQHAVLIDRLWPRGLHRQDAPFDTWLKEVAPSSELRKWYGHEPARFERFADRYRAELSEGQVQAALDQLREMTGAHDVTLLTATKDLEHSHAVVLREVLVGS